MDAATSAPPGRAPHHPWYTILYVQVLIAIALGILLGHFFPSIAIPMKPLGDGFIALIKMMIAPVIFCTVVHGISSMSDLKKIGRIGLKTLVYFEVVSTVALARDTTQRSRSECWSARGSRSIELAFAYRT